MGSVDTDGDGPGLCLSARSGRGVGARGACRRERYAAALAHQALRLTAARAAPTSLDNRGARRSLLAAGCDEAEAKRAFDFADVRASVSVTWAGSASKAYEVVRPASPFSTPLHTVTGA